MDSSTSYSSQSATDRLAQLRARSNVSAGGRRWLFGGLLVGAVVALLLLARLRGGGQKTAVSPARPGIPVAAMPARSGDLNIYLTALGTVNPYNSVTVKSRVDGELVKVSFEEGQLVHQGDLLAEIDPRPFNVQLEQATAQYSKDHAALNNSRTLLERDQALFAHGVIARQDLDNQQSAVHQFEGSLGADQANIDNARLQLTFARITAPLSGRIGLRHVDQGNMVHATDPQGLAVIAQLQPIAVLFSIPENDIPRVTNAIDASSRLPVDAYDRDLKHKLAQGALLTVDNQIDTTTGTVKLKASFPNQDNHLFPNQFVNVQMLVDKKLGAVLVPAASIQRGTNGTFVYVVNRDNTVAMRKIKLGAVQGDLAAVDNGVAAGELVVTDGMDRLTHGTKVIVSAPSNAGAEVTQK